MAQGFTGVQETEAWEEVVRRTAVRHASCPGIATGGGRKMGPA